MQGLATAGLVLVAVQMPAAGQGEQAVHPSTPVEATPVCLLAAETADSPAVTRGSRLTATLAGCLLGGVLGVGCGLLPMGALYAYSRLSGSAGGGLYLLVPILLAAAASVVLVPLGELAGGVGGVVLAGFLHDGSLVATRPALLAALVALLPVLSGTALGIVGFFTAQGAGQQVLLAVAGLLALSGPLAALMTYNMLAGAAEQADGS